jgi:hypothetical protein
MITDRRSPISVTERRDVVEHPRALERVDARPQRGLAEVGLAPDAHEPGSAASLFSTAIASSRLPSRCRPSWRGRELADDLLVARVEEVDHPRRRHGDLEQRIGCADGEGLGEVTGVAHGGPGI